jgi:hypothetical protein
LEGGGEVSLPQFLKVRVQNKKDGREYFEILEGANKGQRANVSVRSDGGSYLVKTAGHLPTASVRFNRDQQALWYGERGPFNAFSGEFDSFTRVPTGLYRLQIPFAPSSETRPEYYRYTDYHKTWFRLGTDPIGSRFLHVGEISEGCVTVRAFVVDESKDQPTGFGGLPKLPTGAIGLPYPSKSPPIASWNDVYEYLIIRRFDDQSVGTLRVV